MEYRVKTYEGRRHSVTVGPNGFTVDGVAGNCLVLREGSPLILAEATGRLDQGDFSIKVLLNHGEVMEIFPVGRPVEV